MEIETRPGTGVPFSSIGRTYWLPNLGAAILILGAIVLFWQSLPHVDVQRMTDIGLVSVLPTSVFIALGLLCFSYCFTLHQHRLYVPLLLLHLIVMIFMLYGLPAFVEETPRFPVTWRHVGVTEYVIRKQSVDPNIDAYFNWPGFFIFMAFVTEIAGLPSGLSFGTWASVFFNILYLGPLYMILKSSTQDKRVVWLGLWFFYLTNWIGQDYWSPQALNYFLYLVILAVLLGWFRTTRSQQNFLVQYAQGGNVLSRLASKIDDWLSSSDLPSIPSSPIQRAILVAIVVLLFSVIVPSHQLTPFFTLAAVTTLVIYNRCTLRGLPLLMAILLGTWLSYMTVAYMSGHLNKLVEQVGEVEAAIGKNVTGRIQGSPEHVFVVYMRLAMTVVIWGLAFLGGVRRLRKGYLDLTYALLATSPFPIMGLQGYGGEMLLRVYLFALPFMTFFAALLFYTTPTTRTSWRSTFSIGFVSILLLSGFFVTRYGNERMDYFTSKEVDAVHHLYKIAEPNSLFVAVGHSLPWKFQKYDEYRYKVAIDLLPFGDVDGIANLMANLRYPNSYLILTRSQKAYVEMFHGVPPGSWEQFEQDLEASNEFKLVFSNEDAKIFVLLNRTAGAVP